MGTDPSSRARPPNPKWFEDGPTNRIAALLMGGLLIYLWSARGPDHPVYGLLVAGWTLVLGVVIAIPVMLSIPERWFRVPAAEGMLHRVLGVGAFGRLLDLIGWNRIAVPTRGFNGTRTTLRRLEMSARCGASAHAVCFVVHILLTAFALSTGHPWGALWILLSGVPVHFYPALLQRSLILRLQPLLEKPGAA